MIGGIERGGGGEAWVGVRPVVGDRENQGVNRQQRIYSLIVYFLSVI